MSPSSGKMLTWSYGLLGIWTCLLFRLVWGQDLVYVVPEERDPNYFIGNIANDTNIIEEINKDSSIVLVRYSFLSSTNLYTSYFHIYANTSDLYLTAKLDRDSFEDCEFSDSCVLPLDVMAQSLDGSFFRRIKVDIILADVNDNEPVFTKNSTTIKVPEDTVVDSSWPLEGAIDIDRDKNSVQRYLIIPGNTPFDVDFDKFVDGRTTLSLVLKQNLDRETIDKYHFQILAEDGGDPVLTGTLDVNIIVTDVNDNAPVFKQSTFNVTLNEGVSTGSVILNMSASDRDEGENGRVSFRLSPYQSDEIKTRFAINETYGNLSITKPLVYEPGEIYKITVDVIDHAKPPLMSQATVFVSVLDSTNDPPVINVNLFSGTNTAHIFENARVGSAIAHIAVTDDDIGNNGIVNCSIESVAFNLESLDTNEYKVILTKSLDRETTDEYKVLIRCHDFGIPPSVSSVRFNVSVSDINDNAPRFTKISYTVDVPENNKIGASILQVSADDFDHGINAEVTYSLENTGNYDFTVDNVTGVIFANFKLDRENTTHIQFLVVSVDSGTPAKSGTADVIINLIDVNDNRPVFGEPVYSFTVTENQNVDTFVGVVNATDADEGVNADIQYSLLPGVSSLPFHVSKNGVIYTSEILDREKYPHGFNFDVIVYDLGNSISLNSTCHVNIFISDLNDNDPKLIFPNPANFTISILFDIPVGSVIGRILASDIDHDESSRLSFSMEDNDLFKINENNGDVSLTQALTPADVNRYPLTVTVEDRGSPKRSVNGSLVVIVTSHLVTGMYREDRPNDTNLLLAVIICCVTIVLAGIIILAIFLIRRHDRIKFLRGNKPPADVKLNTNSGNDMYDALEKSTEISENMNDKQKRVSLNSSPNTSQEQLLVDKTSARSSVSEDEVEKILERISSPSSFHSRSSLSASESSSRYMQVRTSRSPSVNSNYQLPQTRMSYASNNGSENSFPQIPEGEIITRHQQSRNSMRDLPIKTRDNDSESSMESNTSDSGRGGSDCDVQSSGGLTNLTEPDMSSVQISANHNPKSRPGDQKLELQKLRPQCHQFCNNKSHLRPSNDNRILYSDNKNRINRLPRTSKHNPPTRELQYDYHKHKPSVHWNPVTHVMNGNLATIEDYDDASTTTSGSYTVDDSGNEHCIMSDSVV